MLGKGSHRAKSGTLPSSGKVSQNCMAVHQVKSKMSQRQQVPQEEPQPTPTMNSIGTQRQHPQKGHRRVSSNQLQKQKIANRLLQHDHKYNSHLFNELATFNELTEHEESLKALDKLKNSIQH